MGGYTVIHFQNDLKVVINFLMQYIFDVCINGFYFGIPATDTCTNGICIKNTAAA